MAEEKKKRRGRRAYLEGFQKTVGGDYAFTGPSYTYVEQGMTHRRAMAVRWALGAGAAALELLCGSFPAPGMSGCPYVLLPYAAALLSLVSVVWAVARMAYWGSPLREYVYRKTAAALPKRCMAAAAFAFVTLLGETVYLLRNGGDGVGILCRILFFALQIGVLGCALGLRQFEQRQKWST